MARIQILELPEGSGDDRPPFVLVVDQVDDELAEEITQWPDDIATRIGARQILCLPGTIDIPANEVPVDPDGYPLKIRVEGDFEQFREQVQHEIRKAQAEMAERVKRT